MTRPARVILGLLIFIFISSLYAAFISPQKPTQDVSGLQTKASPSPTPTQELERIQVNVVKVVDGDTVTVSINGSNKTIRIIGLDTPETVDPRKPIQCFGIAASNRAKELLTGKTVFLEADSSQGNTDKYDRLLRYVFLNDGTTDYGLTTIAEGYGHEYTYDLPYKYQKQYKEAQAAAIRSKKGLWADNACGTPSPTPSQSMNNAASDKDCKDFKTHAEAQNYFKAQGGSPSNNIDNLDPDHDGIACESLP